MVEMATELACHRSPAFSLDGKNCGAGQSGKVWFLTGTFTTEFPENEFTTVIRESCSVPLGKAIYFPTVNIECSTLESDPFLLIEEGEGANVDDCAANFFDGPLAVFKNLSVTIDGKALSGLDAYRFQSPVFGFTFENNEDNLLGVDCSSVDCSKPHAVSDGYWVMIPPLSPGKHVIRFTGKRHLR